MAVPGFRFKVNALFALTDLLFVWVLFSHSLHLLSHIFASYFLFRIANYYHFGYAHIWIHNWDIWLRFNVKSKLHVSHIITAVRLFSFRYFVVFVVFLTFTWKCLIIIFSLRLEYIGVARFQLTDNVGVSFENDHTIAQCAVCAFASYWRLWIFTHS